MKRDFEDTEDGVNDVVEKELEEAAEALAEVYTDPKFLIVEAGEILASAVQEYGNASTLLLNAIKDLDISGLDVNSVSDVKERIKVLLRNWHSGRPFDFVELAALAAIGLSKGL